MIGWLSEVVFEGVEKVEEFVADPFAVAAAADAGWTSTPVSSSRLRAALAAVGVTPYREAAVSALTRGWAGRPRMILRATESVRGEPARSMSSEESVDTSPELLGGVSGCGGVGEGADPVVGAALSEIDEAGDVSPGVGGQHDADRGDEEGGEAPSAEDHVDEAPAGASVAVAEGWMVSNCA